MSDRVEPSTEVGTERELVLGWLAFHRGTLATKCAGLTPEQLITRSVPPSRLSLLGLVRHMTEMERVYLNRPLRGLPVELLYCTEGDEEGDFESLRADRADVDLARWRSECESSDQLLVDFDMDEKRPSGRTTVRWLVQKLLGEYSRHNGHADLLRESIDGQTGE